MRCPNLECRQVFTVEAKEAAAPPPPVEPPPPPPQPKVATPNKPGAGKPPKPKSAKLIEAEVVEAVVVEAAIISPPKVKEVVWAEGTDVPPPKKSRKPLKPEQNDDSLLPLRRKKKSSKRPLILAGMGIISAAVVIFAIFYILYYQSKNEEKLAERAKEQYSKGEYSDAAKSYEKLMQDYSSSKKFDEYKFFADLASMQIVVRSVTNRENYETAVGRLETFINAYKDSPFAKPTSGFGHDILEAGKKLGEDIAAHAEDRVKDFVSDRAHKGGELARADKAIAVGRGLIPVLDPFRAADDPPLDNLKKVLDEAEKHVKHERDRTAAINRARSQLDNPTDAIIQSVVADLQTAGFLDDSEAQAMIAAAKGKLRDLVRYEDDPAAPLPPPPTVAASLLFVTSIGETKARDLAAGDAPAIFLCVARGILYAIKEDRGTLAWATRVGPDVIDPPAVARVQLATGLTDLAVATSNVGNAPAVTGQELTTGVTRWYQPLPAPAVGPAVIVGTRAFVATRDPLGTVYEFDLTTGTRVGRIRLGQAIADRGIAIRPGTSLLYVAADARRLYVIDAGGKDDDGNRVNPQCVQVIATGHLPGTLRVPPVFIGPEGTEPADRWMILAQADGTARTLLRAFAVGPISPPPADGSSVPETPAVPAISLPVPGWVTFAPVSDGERLAVITDTGHFRLFGVNQIGNVDKPLFPLPSPAAPPATERTMPGLAIPVEESTYWLLANGQLQKARLALVPNRGQEVVMVGSSQPVGEPVHAVQFNGRRDTACIVVRSLNSSGCRAIAFNLHDGEIRWQRQLGLVPAKMSSTEQPAAPITQGNHFILVDEDGGIVAMPVASGIGIGQTLSAPQTWALSSAPKGATGPTVVVSSAGGKSIYTVTPVNREGPKFVIRRVVDGKLAHQDEVNAPAALAGQPAIVGESLLIPTADGFVNRLVPGDGRVRPGSLVAGPPWMGERRNPNAACSITPISDSAFATSDGGKKLNRWDWPTTADGKWNQTGSWELRQEVAGPGVVLPPSELGSSPRLIVADTSGSVWLFAADRAGQPLRRWRPGGASIIPVGRPSSAFAVQTSDPAHTVVAFIVDGKVAAAINPESEDPVWATRTGEDASSVIVGTPQPAGANRWVITDLAGRVLLVDGTSGEVIATQTVGLPGAVPAAASGVAGNSTLTPLSDGSAVVIELPKPAMPGKKE